MSDSDGAAFHRQHPLAWVFPALAALRSTVVPAILFLVFWQGCAFGWIAILLIVPAAVSGVARYLATTYALTASELVVRDGLLSRNERRVRYSRIQNVDEIQGLIHRLLGVVSVRVETASGSEAEAVLILGPAAVDGLRRAAFGDELAADEGAESEPALLEVPPADLARLGLIKNRGFVVVAAVLGFAYQSGSDLVSSSWERVGGWIRDVGSEVAAGQRQAPTLDTLTWILGLALLLIGGYLLLAALSITLAFLRFAGFTLRRQGDDLTARFGLLSRLRITIPRRRIQRLQVDESLMHRVWKRLSIRLDTAGGAGGSSDSSLKDADPTKGKQWLAPVTTRDRLDGLLAAALPAAALDPLATDPEASTEADSRGWRAVDPAATQRLFNRTSLLVLALSFGLAWISRWSLALPLVALPLVWWIGKRSIAARRYWPTEDALWWRRGWPGRRLVVLPYDKIQSVVVGQTPFDRRYGMARVTIDTAGSGLFPAAQIAYLDAAQANDLARQLAREASRSEFVWA